MIELYVKNGCPHCRRQIEQLEQAGLPFQLYDVDNDPSALKEAKEKYGANIVPVLVENGEVKLIGYQNQG